MLDNGLKGVKKNGSSPKRHNPQYALFRQNVKEKMNKMLQKSWTWETQQPCSCTYLENKKEIPKNGARLVQKF